MRPAELIPTGIADQLARMYRADHGHCDDSPSPTERTALADELSCQKEAWAAWAVGLNPLG